LKPYDNRSAHHPIISNKYSDTKQTSHIVPKEFYSPSEREVYIQNMICYEFSADERGGLHHNVVVSSKATFDKKYSFHWKQMICDNYSSAYQGNGDEKKLGIWRQLMWQLLPGIPGEWRWEKTGIYVLTDAPSSHQLEWRHLLIGDSYTPAYQGKEIRRGE
jgi:hypothetical protein